MENDAARQDSEVIDYKSFFALGPGMFTAPAAVTPIKPPHNETPADKKIRRAAEKLLRAESMAKIAAAKNAGRAQGLIRALDAVNHTELEAVFNKLKFAIDAIEDFIKEVVKDTLYAPVWSLAATYELNGLTGVLDWTRQMRIQSGDSFSLQPVPYPSGRMQPPHVHMIVSRVASGDFVDKRSAGSNPLSKQQYKLAQQEKKNRQRYLAEKQDHLDKDPAIESVTDVEDIVRITTWKAFYVRHI
ncbi:hypothetical protein SARC_07262 [Sphaeroforma arctica JP610]|uniref:Uncharacterized protein n=1 Tax=Sphaeroforma arctica JP610 TaxID=667725 RepID=A0A0L0FUY5_9EUKA|nr:hypothetical protein SARC_07262 [Sphaeroforma arctica JP610]KNC80376.1 hypothetical protein SARC_07262 [Sphaeroforma arctica JP610]|eukprot:XP_014154278.1 hypothetical protein SARC_07262 [Sphaeroforma arctica JP610]